MKRLVTLGLAILLLGAAPPPAARPVAEALAWLSGDWAAKGEDGWTEERWSDAHGGMLLGTGRSGKGDTTSFFEFLRIAPDADGQVVLTVMGQQGAPVGFVLTALAGQSAVFENPGHDYPTRIFYRRTGKVLTAEISGPNGANVKKWVFQRR